MAGHGRPRTSRRARSRATLAAAARWAALAAGLLGAAAAQGADQLFRVRIEWGGGAQRQWQGTIAVAPGALADPRALGVEADSPGSMWIDDGRLAIVERSLRAYDGVDVTVSAPADAKLSIDLQPAGAASQAPIEIPLADISAEYQTRPLDDQQNRLLVRRAPGDKLRVTFTTDCLVFDPGQRVPFELEPYQLGVADGTKVRCELRLTSAAGGDSVWSLDRELTAEADNPSLGRIAAELELPSKEGVYDLTIAALTRSRLGWKQSVADRKVQLVVVDRAPPTPPFPAIKAETAETVEIDPASPGWWDRIAAIPLLPGMKRGPWGNGPTALVEHPLGPFVQLEAAAEGEEPRWQAYPVPIAQTGKPHLLEVEYPSDAAQALGISIVEPNAAGTVAPIGLDSGVYVADEGADGAARIARHRLVFWPRTAAPVVLVTNRQDGAVATFGKVRVTALGDRATGDSADNREPPEGGGRLLAGYLDRPLFPENFSAPESLDPWSNRSLDDWTTFYQGALRLIEALRRGGSNGLLLTVTADGSAIYPSRLLASTPRYETGVFFSTGQDPAPKDVLELLFRIFDRERLSLVPVVQFAAPLPELEALLRGAPAERVGLELVGRDGLPLPTARPPRRGLAPYYNPLDDRVQEAMVAVASELADRYGSHPSFGGLGVQLAASGYAQLPGPQWGFDDRTVARFTEESGARVPGTGNHRIAQRADHLLGKGRSAWLAWRAERLEALYKALEACATNGRPQARLYLAGTGLLDDAELRREWRPPLPRRVPLERALLDVGLAPDLGRRLQQTVHLRPQEIGPPGRLTQQAVDVEFNESPEIDRLYRDQETPGALFYHPPLEARLPTFDAKTPFKKSYTWLVGQLLPSEAQNRRRFVHSLATLDSQVLCDGGWLLPLGQEDALAELAADYRRLPAEAFETFEGATQPVTVRTLSQSDRTWLYLVNDSPWPVKALLRLEAPRGCDLKPATPARRLPALVRAAEGAMWELELQPYDLVAAYLTSGAARVADVRVTVDPEVIEELEGRIAALEARTAVLNNPAPITVVENASFDAAAIEGGPPGWTLSDAKGASAAVDKARPHDGPQALRLTSRGALAILGGAPFDAPHTGRLSVSVWLRVADAERQPPLRLAVQGELDGAEYYRHATVGDGPDAVPIGDEWGQYVFHIPDLPVEGLSPLRVRFDLMGAGEVWLDHVQVFDLVFSKDERIELDSRIIALASAKLRHGEIGDCRRLLDGYWPRYLAAHVTATEVAQLPEPPPEAAVTDEEAPPQEAQRPSWIDRLKGVLPGGLRF
jgi:hypothetical protein